MVNARQPMAHVLGRLFPLATLVVMALLLGACTGGAPPERGAEMRIQWVLPQEFPAFVSIHRMRDGQPSTLMRSYARGESPDVGDLIEDGLLQVELDRAETVLVVLRNPLDRPVRFWAAPHLPVPHHAETALMIRCLCTGETYEVPAGGTWVRAVQFGIRRRDAVDRMAVAHVITIGDAPSVEGSAPR